MQSNLSKLKLFLDTLPKDKIIDEWDERYIYDADSMGGHEHCH